MKAGVTPKMEAKWWKDNKDLLVPEQPLYKALQVFEKEKATLKKDECYNSYHQVTAAVDGVKNAARDQVGKCNKLLHKDTIAALQKYAGVADGEKDDLDNQLEKYKSAIKVEVDKVLVKAEGRLKRLEELEAAVKDRMKNAPKAVKEGKGREATAVLASDLKELTTRYTDCNAAREEVEGLDAKRDYALLFGKNIGNLKKDMTSRRTKVKQTLEVLRDLIDSLTQKQGDQDGQDKKQALEKFKKDVDDLARKITDRKLDAMLGLGDVAKIKVDNDNVPTLIGQQRKLYTQYEQDLAGFIKEAANIQRPVALLLNKSEDAKPALKKLKEVLADDAVNLKKRCAEVTKNLDDLDKQAGTYQGWVKRSEELEKKFNELEEQFLLALKQFDQAKELGRKQTLEAVYQTLFELVSRAENREGLNPLIGEMKAQGRDMPLSSTQLADKLKYQGQKLDKLVKEGGQKLPILAQFINEFGQTGKGTEKKTKK
jgi:DNA repair exonuclease SbcCD ATPase subunit